MKRSIRDLKITHKGVRVSQMMNSNSVFNNNQKERDKQQTNNSAWEINNTLKEWDNEKRKGLFEI